MKEAKIVQISNNLFNTYRLPKQNENKLIIYNST